MNQRIIYYYQTFDGLDNIIYKQPIKITHLHLASIHFNYINNEPIIHLNDNEPSNSKFNNVWLQTKQLSKLGVKIILMIGGAGGGFKELFQSYNIFFPLLINILEKYNWIDGIDLDVEEVVKLSDIKKLINDIYVKFDSNFIISMAPIQGSLSSDIPGISGFIYKDLYNSYEGSLIHYFNTQAYFNFSFKTLENIINNGYDPNKIVLGTLSSQFLNNFTNFLKIILKCRQKFPSWGGVYNWEYYNSPPDHNDPSKWAEEVYNKLNNFT